MISLSLVSLFYLWTVLWFRSGTPDGSDSQVTSHNTAFFCFESFDTKLYEMEPIKVFGEKFQTIIKDGLLKAVENKAPKSVEPDLLSKQCIPIPINNWLTCSYCRIQFQDNIQQREHYKLDWHRYNLKQSLLNKEPITEEEFNGKTEQDEISSISGSDSESENLIDTLAAQGKIFLQNDKGTIVSIYSCLLFDKKTEMWESALLLSDELQRKCSLNHQKWTVLMLGGGHFAGAVFNGEAPILHKTFHCYTVRAGQGGAQSSRDNTSSHPKSAGASLRRYNEQSLIQHVRTIIENWREPMETSSLIFFRATGPYNRSVLFGGSCPILNRNDSRLRTIPFSTRRATFAEVKRVHAILCTAQIYESYQVAIIERARFPQQKANNKNHKLRRDKSREINERKLEKIVVSSSSSSTEENCQLVEEMKQVSFDLQQFDDTLKPEHRRKPRKKHTTKMSETKKVQQEELERKRQVYDLITKGNVEKLTELLETNSLKIDEIFDETNNTILHLAAMNEHTELVKVLLEKGANPCLKNRQQQTVYTVMQNKKIRQILKDFARDNPKKYNYNKAQIPLNSITAEKVAEKRKIKKEKEKVKRKESETKRREEEEKERFLRLSDREKRALAAERRILNQSSIVRCFLCGQDITGQVPFEYLGNRFCSVKCLKGHRLKNVPVLS